MMTRHYVLMNGISRRGLLAGIAGIGIVGGIAKLELGNTVTQLGAEAISARENTLFKSGRARQFDLTARLSEVDLGGIIAKTWTYNDSLPGKVVRANIGDRLKVNFTNQLPVSSSIHWHGLAIRNDMDGVPGVTTPEVAAKGKFHFDFTVPDSGTYWFHPHSGTQLDRGLYAPLIVDDPAEVVDYDSEWIVILDDWTDGVGKNPDEILAELKNGAGADGAMGGMGGMGDMGSMGGMSGMDGGDVTYPMYLINGRPINDPEIFSAKPGERIRIRIINASADTIFDIAIAEHILKITHTDGYPVVPQDVDSLRIGMGERYDIQVLMKDGVFPLVAAAYGKSQRARALIRTGSGTPPLADFQPVELNSTPLTAEYLKSTEASRLPSQKVSRVQDLILSGNMQPYEWMINGRTYENTKPLFARLGETGMLKIRNRSMMSHPLHLHGHTFQLGRAGGSGPRKDTVLIPPMGGVNVDFAATNPGNWMIHCHNAYHAEAGMMTRLEYIQ